MNHIEIVVISGKGGTGKTSIAASFAAMADNAVLADCDVDASDLHLLLDPENIHSEDFISGRKAVINQEKCISCGACLAHCRFGAIKMDGDAAGVAKFAADKLKCEGCGVCVKFCPANAIEFPEENCGNVFMSKTRFGMMSHAALKPGAGNSGKLVSKVRENARSIAERDKNDMIITDGPPGIGCPVIASLTGAKFAVLVTEPTVSGMHDMQRALDLLKHFNINCAVCVNKYDINLDMTKTIEASARSSQLVKFVSRVRYDKNVTASQIQGIPLVEFAKDGASADVSLLWKLSMEAVKWL